MEGKYPKRRKDKYNPYTIFEFDGKCYISFKDGQGVLQEFEISKELYDVFDDFELADLSHLNVVDRHLEQSEVRENTLNVKAFYQPETVEDIVLHNIQVQCLHKAIKHLPEIQRHRLLLYFFEGMTYEEIAKVDGCSKVAVKYVLDKAIQNLKKILK